MINGRFGNTSGRPYLEAHIILPTLGLQGSVSFLVDTGADVTTLMPSDAVRLGVDFSTLQNPGLSYGAGGAFTEFTESGHLLVADGPTMLYGYDVNFALIPPAPDRLGNPSLLGRDVLNHWKITFDHSNGLVQAEVNSSDHQLPVI